MPTVAALFGSGIRHGTKVVTLGPDNLSSAAFALSVKPLDDATRRRKPARPRLSEGAQHCESLASRSWTAVTLTL